MKKLDGYFKNKCEKCSISIIYRNKFRFDIFYYLFGKLKHIFEMNDFYCLLFRKIYNIVIRFRNFVKKKLCV